MSVAIPRTLIQRCYLSLTTWFYHPDIDMKSWEILSRGSATIIIPPTLPLADTKGAGTSQNHTTANHHNRRSSSSSTSSSVSSSDAPTAIANLPWQLLASYHVTHPYQFPQYYPSELYPWLDLLTSSNLRYTIEVRHPSTGQILNQFPLPYRKHPQRQQHNHDHHHPYYEGLVGHPGGRDVSAMNLSPSFITQFLASSLFDSNLPSSSFYQILPLRLSTSPISETASVAFHGHFLRNRSKDDSLPSFASSLVSANNVTDHQDAEDDAAVLLRLSHKEDHVSYLEPRSIPGRVLVRSSHQIFARTKEVLEMGMCGGPVTLDTVGMDSMTTPTSTEKEKNITNNPPTLALPDSLPLCYGIIEGIVPVTNDAEPVTDNSSRTTTGSNGSSSTKLQNIKKLLSGCTVFIETDTLYDFCYNLYTEGLYYNNKGKK